MKRARCIAVWLVVLMMLCGLLGCAKEPEPTPEELYVAAYEKINTLSAMDAQISMNLAMTAEGETMAMGMDAVVQMEDLNSENMKMAMEMSMDMLGVTIDIQAYYEDGYYLMDMVGQKIRYRMPMEEAIEQASMMQEVAVDALSEITMTEEDGMRILNFSVDATKMTEDYMDAYLADMGMSDSTDNLEYKSVKGVMKINEEGYPEDITVEMAFTMGVEGTIIECAATAAAVYNNPGQPVSVEIPDASEYMEVDSEMMP